MKPEEFKRLCAMQEGISLDFKVEMYDWSQKKQANAELAKDIMAMANLIAVGEASSFILFGVAEREDDRSGRIVGMDPNQHPADADLQQKVRSCSLNKVPRFKYHQLTVDDDDGNGVSVGALEVIGGERPYFALREVGVLKRHVALIRTGSGTDIASPTQIQQWAVQDNPVAHELQEMEASRYRAQNTPRAKLRGLSVRRQDENFGLVFTVVNEGDATFDVVGYKLVASLGDPVGALHGHGVEADITEGDAEIRIWEGEIEGDCLQVRPGESAAGQTLPVDGGLLELRDSLVRMGFPSVGRLSLDFRFYAEFKCRSQAGIETTISGSTTCGWILTAAHDVPHVI